MCVCARARACVCVWGGGGGGGGQVVVACVCVWVGGCVWSRKVEEYRSTGVQGKKKKKTSNKDVSNQTFIYSLCFFLL